ncbi:MAG: iron transporter substrate-binding protein [Anaerosporomusa subterranea]|jgi:iron(III) transport system substrate-binding protein|nr:iron transporter substrate-binding protein [Anaerosporomusa subterranea]
MSKKSALLLAIVMLCSILLAGCGGSDKKAATPAAPAAGKKLIIYTSMKESLISGIVEGFKKKNPGIEVDYQSAGAGKLMAKIAAERQSGKILADIIWTSEVPDFYNMKKEGILEQYKTPLLKDIVNPFDDYDGYFTAARLGTLGIAINTDKIKTPPAQWSDLFKPEYKGAFGIADPALSGTAYMSVALLEKQFGWEFFDKLRANGARIGKGSGQVVDDTASGELAASLAVDYITYDKIEKGAHIALYYPPELLLAPSPVAIFKGGNVDAAKKFVDYLLDKEAQTLIAGEGTLSVRTDVTSPEKLKLPASADAWKRSIKIDYVKMMDSKKATIKKFTDTLQGKK